MAWPLGFILWHTLIIGTTGFPEPNWMFVASATLAGLAYGWTWHKTGKITVAALVHAIVNFVWGLFLTA